MNERHWSEEELIAHLYGAGPSGDHLERCAHCAERWEALQAARRSLLNESIPESNEFFASQLCSLRERTNKPAQGVRWPALAVLGASLASIFAAFVIFRPQPTPAPEFSDAELFSSAYELVWRQEPEAVQTMHALFEVEP